MFWDVTRGVCETPSSDAIQMIPLCLQAIHVVSRIMISMFNEFCASIQLKDDKLLNSKSMLLFSFCFRFIQIIPWIFQNNTLYSVWMLLLILQQLCFLTACSVLSLPLWSMSTVCRSVKIRGTVCGHLCLHWCIHSPHQGRSNAALDYFISEQPSSSHH